MNSFEKLNTQFSTKNLDTAQITKALTEHQNSILKLALVMGAVLAVVLMYNDLHTKEQQIHSKMSNVRDKLEMIKTRDAAIQSFKDFESSLPKKLSEIQLIDLISDYAKSHHVVINSLSPAESKDMGLYDIINVSFNGNADNYRDMLFFLRSIEKSKYSLRIDSWSGNEQEGGQVAFTIAISAVLIHT